MKHDYMLSILFATLLVYPFLTRAEIDYPDNCIPGETPVLCELKPELSEFKQCIRGNTPVLCDMKPGFQKTACPSLELNMPSYKLVGCKEEDEIKYAVYAMKENFIKNNDAGFSYVTATDFDYKYVYIMQSHNKQQLIDLSGCYFYENNSIFLKQTKLPSQKFFQGVTERGVAEDMTVKSGWMTLEENLVYMGPGDGIKVTCYTSIKIPGDDTKINSAVSYCAPIVYIEEGAFEVILNSLFEKF